jgi:micrococcal nuclease
MLRSCLAVTLWLATFAACLSADDSEPVRGTGAGHTPMAGGTAPPIDRAICELDAAFCASTGALQRAAVVEIIDGDTLDITIDGREERVRVFGIDTAERGEACFAAASLRLSELAGEEVRLLPDARDRDRSGRLLRYVYSADGVSLDALMVHEGFAHAWTRDGALRDPLVALEAQARDARRGCLWGG